MEGRSSRGRGGGWKRGGRAANDSDGSGGDHRGRGGHHRGRGRRDQHRGRGRGGGSHAAEFQQRDGDAGGHFEEDDDRREVFRRRKLESNWDRYEQSEKQEAEDEAPAQRGTDYHALLESAGDSFTQFRFSEEKDWELDSPTATQMSAVFLDLPALAQSLQQVPLHRRLNLEAELVQVSTPVELPTVAIAPKQEMLKTFVVPSEALKGLSTNRAPAPAPGSAVQVPAGDDCDEELNQLLSLQKPAPGCLDGEAAADEAPEKACDETEDDEVKDDGVAPKAASVRQEVTEEDLEDWLDSMIS